MHNPNFKDEVMSETMSRLEAKIQDAIDTIEMQRMEIAELKQRNDELEKQQQDWEDKLNALIEKFEQFEAEEETASTDSSGEDSSEDDSSYEATTSYQSPSYESTNHGY
jgi:cell division protein ZapB